MDQTKLQNIVVLHAKWLRGEPDGVRADLSRADLSRADLSRADLSRADLSRANLFGAYLSRANLSRAKDIPSYATFITTILPEGNLIGYKKCYINGDMSKPVIVKLSIPSYAQRSNATGRKCRCSECKVLEFIKMEYDIAESDNVVSVWDSKFVYRIGEIVKVDNFDTDRWRECSTGIHFFITKEEALVW